MVKRKSRFVSLIGKRNIFFAIMALILVSTTAVGATESWIEDISQVKFKSDDGQETPLHVGSKVLDSDAVMTASPSGAAIDLGNYFYKSGDMHLSPCYSNGEDFYFPYKDGETTEYRVGTKDDANVNYISVTFRVRSVGADTVFWFEKKDSTTPYVAFKDGNSSVSGMGKYLRCSLTVDGATNVYCFDDEGDDFTDTYNTLAEGESGLQPVSPAPKGRNIRKYSYYDEVFNEDATSANVNSTRPNQGSGGNLNGNTLFSVNQYDENNKAGTIKTVTLKIWLEYGAYDNGDPGNPVGGVDLSQINLKLVSSWDKTRRIYVVDKTVDEWDAGLNNGSGDWTGENWLSSNSNLFWVPKPAAGNVTEDSIHYAKTGNITDDKKQYFDIPAVYNNAGAYLYRCSTGWNEGNAHSNDIKYWDKYTTVFPNTFHSETYTVYTKTFGTWETTDRHVKIVNSCQFNGSPYNNENQFTSPYAYMWDSSTDVSGQKDKVVQNATWPGVQMTKLNSQANNLDIYAFYYNSIFDRIIFNDNYTPKDSAYQTEDINLDNPQNYNGKIYDMATMQWYANEASLPTYSDYSVYGDFYNSTGNHRYTVSRMVENPENSNEVYCRVYVRYENSADQYYYFQIMKNDKKEFYGWTSGDGHPYTINDTISGDKPTLTLNGKYLQLHASKPEGSSHPGVYEIYFNTNDKKLWVQRRS